MTRPAATAPKTELRPPRVFVVSHTHWDREWYEPFQQFRFRLVDLIDEVLRLLGDTPSYNYFMLDGQTILLEDYLAIRPERAAEIRRYIEAGRLLVGPWYVLPDEFLVSPESLIRNLQRGRGTICRAPDMGRVSGMDQDPAADGAPRGAMTVGYVPDPFGHIGQLPQLLRGFGITAAAVGRGLGKEPVELQWEAPDGSRVLLIYLRDGYGNFAWLPLEPQLFTDRLEQRVRSLLSRSTTANALLLNGTDHLFPEPQLPELLQAARAAWPEWEIEHSTLPHYIDAVRADLSDVTDLPVVTGELRSPEVVHLLPGVLSTRMWIKQANDAAETLLERYAEPLCAWAALLGGADRRAQLAEAWRLLLENHPHDSICGCSIDTVHTEMRPRFAGVMQLGTELVREGLEHLAAQVSLPPQPAPGPSAASAQPQAEDGWAEGWQMKPWPPETCAIVVFNPLATSRTDRVEVEIRLPGPAQQVELAAEDGSRLPATWLNRPETLRREQAVGREELEQILETAWEGHFSFRRIENLRLRLTDEVAELDVLLRDDERAPDMTTLHKFLQCVTAEAPLAQVTHARVRTYSMATGRLCFVAPDVPGHGYRSFQLQPASSPNAARVTAPPGRSIANEFLRVSADDETGTLTLHDLRTGQTFPGLNRLVDGGDAGDLYTYDPPAHESIVRQPRAAAAVEVAATQVDATLTLRYTLDVPAQLTPDRGSRSAETLPLNVTVTARLTHGVARLDLTAVVENTARNHRLRTHYPAADAERAWAAAHFDVVERPTTPPAPQPMWAEDPPATFPQRGWTAIETTAGEGLLVAARGLPEAEVSPDTDGRLAVKLTLLRCVGDLSRDDLASRRGHAGPTFATPEAQCPGRHRFEVGLVPYTNGWQSAIAAAHAFRAPLVGTSGRFRGGALPPSAALLRVEPNEVVLSAVKQPGDGEDGLIVRMWNPTSEVVHGSLRPLFPVAAALQSDLREGLGRQLPVEDNAVKFAIEPKQVVTLRLQLGPLSSAGGI